MPKSGGRSRKWDGGYIRTDSRGRDTYVIRKRIGGKIFEVSTRCHSATAAYKQLVKFESDPEGYRPGGDARPGALTLNADLVAEFRKWSLEEKHNHPRHVRDQKVALAWWAERLGSTDLRTLKTAKLVAELDTAKTARKQKIATLKTFFGWLCKVRHAIERTQDPTLGLSVPQARPAQWTKAKAIPREDFLKLREALAAPWRDAIDVLAGTGWHFSELERFAGAGGEIGTHPLSGAPVLVCPRTKGGEPLRTEVGPEVAEAAGRLMGMTLDYWKFFGEIRKVGKKLEIRSVRPGRFRHSVATWAINAGADPASVAAFLGHKSPATTKRFYATHAVPAKVPTLL